MVSNINKVCFFFPHGIGDVVMATPIIMAIKQKYPNIKSTIVLRSKIEYQLLGGDSSVDELIIWDIHQPRSLKEKLRFIWDLRKRQFDLLIFDHGIDNLKSAIFSLLLSPKFSVGEEGTLFSKLFTYTSSPNYSIHKVENNWKLLEAMGISAKINPKVFFEESDQNKVDSLLKDKGVIGDRYLVIHPGCGAWESHKRWPVENYKKLLSKLTAESALPILFVGGPDERALCDSITGDFGSSSNIINLAGLLSIRQLAALLSSAQLVVGADSGVMHISSAVGARTLSLFGPTHPSWTSPFRNNKVVSLQYSCGPCYFEKQFGCGKPICMEDISETLVLKEIKILLNEESVETYSTI